MVLKFGLKSRIEKTKLVTHIWRRTLLEHCKNILFQLNFFKKPGKHGLSQKSGLISVQNGLVNNKIWDKLETTKLYVPIRPWFTRSNFRNQVKTDP